MVTEAAIWHRYCLNSESGMSEMEPFVKEIEAYAAGKKLALFGSYGWGDGQWMRDWEERMIHAGADIIGGRGLICQEIPDEAILVKCVEYGRELAAI